MRMKVIIIIIIIITEYIYYIYYIIPTYSVSIYHMRDRYSRFVFVFCIYVLHLAFVGRHRATGVLECCRSVCMNRRRWMTGLACSPGDSPGYSPGNQGAPISAGGAGGAGGAGLASACNQGSCGRRSHNREAEDTQIAIESDHPSLQSCLSQICHLSLTRHILQ